jgi:putative hemolysin
MAIEILILVVLILANGFFSMAEMAVVSARKARLHQRAEDGRKGAQAALALAEKPTRFLSTVQIGITLIGILTGVFGGAIVAEKLSLVFERYAWLAPYRETVSATIVVIIVTYLSLVLGELVPKRLALNNAEGIAASVAPLMQFLSKISRPLVSLLTASTDAVLRLLGIKSSSEPGVTEEEIKVLIEQGTDTGVFEEAEHDIVERVFRLGDRTVRSLMTPRPEMVWLDTEDALEENLRKVIASGHSNFVVCKGGLDEIQGIVRAKALLAQYASGQPVSLLASSQPPPVIPETMKALKAIERLRAEKSPFALVVDEYGSIAGMITVTDVLEAIVGEFPGLDESGEEPEATQREDGSWLLDGQMSVHDLQMILELDDFPGEEANYDTISGLFMVLLGRIPVVGDHFEWENLRFEVLDMDGNRVDKVLAAPLPPPEKDPVRK